ncbi:MAG TPA: hypothetical protein VEK57_10425 [Thermoanaerobaculia bacterium]|nr:hypothetical protein [Thermoanaerobaculia bacterium]
MEKLAGPFLPPAQREALLGDLAEEYAAQCAQGDRTAANYWYARQAAAAVGHALVAEAVKTLLPSEQESRSPDMSGKRSLKTIAISMLLNVAAFAAFWIVSFLLIQIAERLLGGWPVTSFAQIAGCAIGVILAIRLEARIMAYFLAGMGAYSISELLIHSVYGIRSAQGAPTHFAVMGAAVLGIMFGAFLAGYFRRTPTPEGAEHGRDAMVSPPVAV